MNKAAPVGKIQDGQRVQVLEKPPRVGDAKTIAYYSFYSGLTGTILHTYPDETASVDIEVDSLPVAIRKRHEKSESQLREKWLGDSAEDDPNQATTGKVRGLKLKYMLLIGTDDMIPIGPAEPKAIDTAPAAPKALESSAPASSAASAAEAPPTRASLEDISAKEQAYLDEIARRATGS